MRASPKWSLGHWEERLAIKSFKLVDCTNSSVHRTSRRESTNGNFQPSATPSCCSFFFFFFKCIIVHVQKFWVILLVRRAKSFAFYSPVNTGLEIEASTVQQGPFLLQSVISLRSGIKKKEVEGARGSQSAAKPLQMLLPLGWEQGSGWVDEAEAERASWCWRPHGGSR